MHRYLCSQKLIRIGVGPGPGFGHESTARTIYLGLRELGYSGAIDLVVRPQGLSETLGKLERLFDGFRSTRGVPQSVESSNLRVVPLGPHPMPTVDLGLIGGDDFERRPHHLGSRRLLTLQPLGWYEDPKLAVRWPSGEETVSLPSLANVPYAMPIVPRPTYAEGTPARRLDDLLQRTASADLAAFYGHGLYRSPHQLLVYAMAVAGLQRRANLPAGRGAVIPVLFDTNFGVTHVKTALIHQGRPADSIDVVALDDPDLGVKLDALDRGRVLIVLAGPVPAEQFERIFRTSTIAPVVGGRNSVNLMGLTGRPYLTSNTSVRFHFDKSDVRLNSAQRAFAGGAKHDASRLNETADLETAAALLTFYLVAAYVPDSLMNRMFAEVALPNDPCSTRVHRALAEMLWRTETSAFAGARASTASAIRVDAREVVP